MAGEEGARIEKGRQGSGKWELEGGERGAGREDTPAEDSGGEKLYTFFRIRRSNSICASLRF